MLSTFCCDTKRARKMSKNERSLSQPSSFRPTITLPQQAVNDIVFSSPGPMTMVSNFFSENDPGSDCRSFSELLSADDSSDDLRFKQHRPTGLTLADQPEIFTVPPGMSPATLLNSPAWMNQDPLGVSHQQTRALHSIQANSHFQFLTEFSSALTAPALAMQQHPSSVSNMTTYQQAPPYVQDLNMKKESSNHSHSEQMISLSSSIVVDKPADDGYNWRKYGQKQVKGSDFPRSYYKCTHPKCPVKKKVERSVDGQITEIIYKGQHNHQPPQRSKRGKDSGYMNGNLSQQENSEFSNDGQTGNSNRTRDRETNSANFSGLSDSEDEGDAETKKGERIEDEPGAKRRNHEFRVADPPASHRAVTEPKIIVQTTSEVDLLDDGYRWRKYGQKVVKGNPYPRSYYKCTIQACNVRKHVERAPSDPKAVITTYEGKHNHDVPAARNNSHNMANNNASQLHQQNALSDKHHSLLRNKMHFKEELR